MGKEKIIVKTYKILDCDVDIQLRYLTKKEKAISASMLLFNWWCYFPIREDTDIDKEIIRIFESIVKSNITENFQQILDKVKEVKKKVPLVIFSMPDGELFTGQQI